MRSVTVSLDTPELDAARQRLLDPRRVYPFPTAVKQGDWSPAQLAEQARAAGVAAVQLDDVLTPEQFIAAGRELGELIPEAAPAVQSRVTAGAILNLVTEVPDTTDVDVRPFSTSYLLMHTESSARRPESQPRYLFFQCLAAAANAVDGQTVLVPSDAVLDQLDAADVLTLHKVRYHGAEHTLLRESSVFCFRDPGDAPLALDVDDDVTDAAAAKAVTAVCTAIHRQDNAFSVPWRRGLLVLVDNHRAFHGRTSSGSLDTGRHLQRLRIIAPAA
jgi:alpha-ketoglutarate-dependent taurine dioxygenase